MSVEALSWAFQQDIRPAAKKLVLLALSNRADEDGFCYPGYKRLASQCSLDRVTVIRQIEALIEDGIILKKDRVRENGSTTSNMYQILLTGGLQDATPPGCRMPPPGLQDATPIYEQLNKNKKTALTRSDFLREIDKGWIEGEFGTFPWLTESEIKLQAEACWDFDEIHLATTPEGLGAARVRHWIRGGVANGKIRKAPSPAKEGAAGEVKAAEPSNPLQDWHKAIAQRVPEAVFRSWFRPMVLVGNECRAPTRFHADFVRQHHGKDFNAVLPGVKITVQPATAKQE